MFYDKRTTLAVITCIQDGIGTEKKFYFTTNESQSTSCTYLSLTQTYECIICIINVTFRIIPINCMATTSTCNPSHLSPSE